MPPMMTDRQDQVVMMTMVRIPIMILMVRITDRGGGARRVPPTLSPCCLKSD
jgi:hypothetical protein